MLLHGTFAKWQPTLKTSDYRGRPEAAGRPVKPTLLTHLGSRPSSPAAARYALMHGAGTETLGGLMYIVIRKYTKVRSVADAARRAKSGIGQILRGSHGFRSYYVLDGGEGVGVAVMIFEDREKRQCGER
jgi:hypothetical protein